MKLQAGIDYAGLWIPMILAAAFALAYLVYFFRNKTDGFSKLQMWLLGSFRFLGIFLVAFFLISPLIETIKKRKEKPLLLVGIDASSSMLESYSDEDFHSQIIEPFTKGVSSEYEINLIAFGDDVRSADSLAFQDKRSNYSAFFDQIDDRYYNMNVGALVVVGDGIFNDGRNPQHVGAGFNFPVFTLGVGDTTSISDQAILSAVFNPNVFLGNDFALELSLNFADFPLRETKLEVSHQGEVVYAETLEVPQSNYYLRKKVVLNANKAGLQNYEVRLTAFDGERNQQNNRNRFTVEVHQNKQRILILSQGPHPDNGALNEALRKQANFEIRTSAISSFDGDFSKYNMVVLNQLPSLATQQNALFSELSKSKTPLLFVVGPNTSVAAFNNMNVGISIKTGQMLEEAKPAFNEGFTRFGFPLSLPETAVLYPPLLTYLSDIELSSTADVLATQNINGVPMKTPLIVTTLDNNRKVGAILGEGIWRWRMKEFQDYGNQNTFDQLMINFATYLSLTQDREQFRVQYERIYSETTPVRIKAQVFNDVYEPVLSNEIRFQLTDSAGAKFDYMFDALGESYFLNLGYLKPGSYQFEASTQLGEKEFNKTGAFIVQEVMLEQQNTRANWGVLAQIAQNSGGAFFTSNQMNELIERVNLKEFQTVKVHRERKISELIDWKLLFVLITILLSLEWFLRKFWGNY